MGGKHPHGNGRRTASLHSGGDDVSPTTPLTPATTTTTFTSTTTTHTPGVGTASRRKEKKGAGNHQPLLAGSSSRSFSSSDEVAPLLVPRKRGRSYRKSKMSEGAELCRNNSVESADSGRSSFQASERFATEVGVEWPVGAEAAQRSVLLATWSYVREGHSEAFADGIYSRFFAREAGVRKMFSTSELLMQKRGFPAAFTRLLGSVQAIEQLGATHAYFGVTQAQTQIFCECVYDSLIEILKKSRSFRDHIGEAWRTVINHLEQRFAQGLRRCTSSLKSERGTSQQEHTTEFQHAPDHSAHLLQIRRAAGPIRRHHAPHITTEPPPQRALPQQRSLREATRVHDRETFRSTTSSSSSSSTPPTAAPTPIPLVPSVPLERPATLLRTVRPTFRVHRVHLRGVVGVGAVRAVSETQGVEESYCEPDSGPREDIVKKRRWVELRGQYLFCYAKRGGECLASVDLTTCELADSGPTLPAFAFVVRPVSSTVEPLVFTCDGDSERELWFARLKRAAYRFSFTKTFCVGESLTILLGESKLRGVCKWFGSVEGTPLLVQYHGLWVGAELTEPVEGGHDGSFMGRRFFTCRNGRGLMVPCYKATTSETTESFYCPENFAFLSVLGRGSFGCVCKVREIVTGEIFACKVLQKASLLAERQEVNLFRERDLLLALSHPYIVRLHSAFQSASRVFLLFDFLPGGDLWFHLSMHGKNGLFKRFSEERGLFYAAEIALGVAYLHSQQVCHRDLKIENLVLDREGHIKITDFGFAKRVDPANPSVTQCGTVPYMAPEVIAKTGYGKAADWWSLGVVTFVMLTSYYPYWVAGEETDFDVALTKEQILNGRIIVRGGFPEEGVLGPEVEDFIVQLLTKPTANRLSEIADIKKHPVFKGFDWEACENRAIKPPFLPNLKGRNTKYFSDFSNSKELSKMTAESQTGNLVGTVGLKGSLGGVTVDKQNCPFAHFNGVRAPSSVDLANDDLADLRAAFAHDTQDQTEPKSSQYIFETAT